MKTRLNFMVALLAFGGVIGFTACNNDDEIKPEVSVDDSTIELVKEVAYTESIDEAIDASVNEAIAAAEHHDPTKSASTTETNCAVITVSPDDGSFPRSVTIDFGEKCTGFSGQTRAGSITIVLTDTLRNPGAKYSVSFDNYSVDNTSVAGSKSVENTGTDDKPAFTENIDITLVTPSDIEIRKTKTSTREWAEGVGTYTLTDDVFLTTGSSEITSSSGRYYSYDITSPLKSTRLCNNILEGEMEIDWSGSDDSIVVDFGNGFCDWKVNITQGSRIIRRAVFLNN